MCSERSICSWQIWENLSHWGMSSRLSISIFFSQNLRTFQWEWEIMGKCSSWGNSGTTWIHTLQMANKLSMPWSLIYDQCCSVTGLDLRLLFCVGLVLGVIRNLFLENAWWPFFWDLESLKTSWNVLHQRSCYFRVFLGLVVDFTTLCCIEDFLDGWHG